MKAVFGNWNWLLILLILASAALGLLYLAGQPRIANLIVSVALLCWAIFKNLPFNNNALRHFDAGAYQLSDIINSLHEGVIVYDENFKITLFNPAAEEIFNLKAPEIVGQSFTLRIKREFSPRLRVLMTILFPALATTIIRRSEPGAYPQIADFSFDNPALDIRVTTNKILSGQGAISYVKLIHDRTRELNLLKLKSDFIAIASHQLQTPLTAINWSIEGLKSEPLSPTQKTLAANTTASVNQLLKIVTDLLDIAKIEGGRFGYKFQELELIEFLENALNQTKPVADQYRVKLYFEKPNEPVKITADPAKLGMVVKNLLDNAIKYNIPNGDVILKLEKYADKPYVEVSIKDTGIGIPAESQNKIFTRFFRGENAVKTAVEGTGLGLFIAKNIVLRHGGAIWVASTLNRGTTFYFTLPTNPTLIPAKEIVYEEE